MAFSAACFVEQLSVYKRTRVKSACRGSMVESEVEIRGQSRRSKNTLIQGVAIKKTEQI